MHIIFIHGTGGNPDEAFFPWCRKELEKLGHRTSAPLSPCVMDPDPLSWCETLMDIYDPHEETVFVGRSSGGNILNFMLEKPEVTAKLAIALATPFDDLGWDNLKKLFIREPDYEAVKHSVEQYEHWYSDDDPHVPLDHVPHFHKLIGGNLREFKGYSHFYNEEFPELIKVIQNLQQKA